MRFRILSHAGLEICAGDQTLLCDPWLIGSTYWRSWWNYPPPRDEMIRQLDPNFIYLSHVHWDHFTAPSLRLFSRDTLIVIPKEPAGRMAEDLRTIGFNNLVELNHGHSISLGSINLTVYQFNVFTDSAAIIEADDVTLFNVNDAKFMGGPLRQILGRHPQIDFVFRSHSSANSRVMYSFIDSPEKSFEDRERYIRDFLGFARATSARYAVPFASNHCHLHKDVYEMNDYIVTPGEVAAVWKKNNVSSPDLKVMVSGDSWDSERGFEIQEQDFFERRSEHLEEYRDRVSKQLEQTYSKEAKSRIEIERIEKYFSGVFKAMPWFMRRYFKGAPILYVLDAGDERSLVEIDFFKKYVQTIESFDDDSHPMQIYTQTALFRHCIVSKLFSHLAISKRVRFRTTKSNLKRLRAWAYFLNFYEYNLFPMRNMARPRFIQQWLLRWREVLLYGHIAVNLVRRRSFRYIDYLPEPRRRLVDSG